MLINQLWNAVLYICSKYDPIQNSFNEYQEITLKSYLGGSGFQNTGWNSAVPYKRGEKQFLQPTFILFLI